MVGSLVQTSDPVIIVACMREQFTHASNSEAEGDGLALLSVEDPAYCSRRGQAAVMKESFRCCFNRGWKNILLSMSGEEDAVFSAGRKIFRHCYCVDEDSIADAGKGRLLLISAGMMGIPLSPLHGSDNALFLLLRGLLS
ncbi:hypothetical protein NC653_027057 [Populus alba x Populus x berolinensis]|uniref:Uncharacterized protein n=1 Tax=Populus alba x Populus x berolinensis TaxID=444605 RepID=A0AAD6M4Q4_9ROSI|nr:hypothetical protein NC653_027057 [Populus alba x Populus x berolinensis]